LFAGSLDRQQDIAPSHTYPDTTSCGNESQVDSPFTENLYIPSSTLLRNFKIYSDKGVNYIVSDIRKYVRIYEDPKYIEKFFSILHAPPSTYGFNRTTWRQKDIR